jgi:hypothetical protein
MPETSVSKILSKLGVSKSLQRIKFGGVVGKQTLLGVICVIGLAAIAWKAEPSAALIIAVLVVSVVVLIAILNFYYAHKHPAEAMLEGAEMLAFQHHALSTKYEESPPDSPVLPNPGGSPPQLNPPQGTEA